MVRVAVVRNRGDRYVDTKRITKRIELGLVRSGRVDVVSALDEADVARQERADQALHASDDTAKTQGEETGSDFLLTGLLLTETAASGARRTLTSLELVEVETQRKAWVGQEGGADALGP